MPFKSFKITKAAKSKQGKTLLGNFMSLGVLQAMRYVIPLLVLPFVTRVVGVVHFGELSIATTFANILQTCVNYSFEFMGARDVAKNREDKGELSRIISLTLTTRFILYFISAAVVLLVALALNAYRPIIVLIMAALTTVFFSMLISEWYFQGIEQMLYITVINVISRIIFVALIFLFLRAEDDYILYPIFNMLGYMFAALFSLYIIFRKHRLRFSFPKVSEMVSYMKSGFGIFVNQVCFHSFTIFPNFLLGLISGSYVTGIYAAAARMSNTGDHSVSILNRTFFPYLSRKISKHDLYAKLNFLFGLLVSVGLFVFAPLIIKIFYAPEFKESVTILRILAFSVLCSSVMSANSTNFLLLLGKDKLVVRTTLSVLIVGICLFVLAAYKFGAIGAAFMVLIMKFSLGLAFYIQARLYKKSHPLNE